MIVVLNKIDLGLAIDLKDSLFGSGDVPHVALSAKTGDGLDCLESLLAETGTKA